MSRCSSTGTFNIVKQSSSYSIYAGGIVGYAYNEAFNYCTNYINIENATYAGGIAGVQYGPEAYYCANFGNISSSAFAGGIIGTSMGYGYTTTRYCGNYGDIRSAIAGGIIARGSQITTIDQCFNKGAITGTTTGIQNGSGGIVGTTYVVDDDIPSTTIASSYNLGSVTGSTVGGIVGSSYGLGVVNCYNKGTITGADGGYNGPIYGIAISSVEMQCLGSGTLSGGIRSTIGTDISGATSNDCYYTFTNISSFYSKTGTYVEANQITTKSLYVDYMFWDEYDPSAKTGEWIFVADQLPSLFIETKLNILP